MNLQELVDSIASGEIRALSRAMRLVEDDAIRLEDIIARLKVKPASSWVLGVTGAPGVGKSSLIDALVEPLLETFDKLAILTVDPSSPFHSGALLGDRARMQRHALNPRVFIRSIASRRATGGLAWSVDALTMLASAAGYPAIVLETVGSGQDDLDIAQLAHTTMVVCAPGMGDSLQAIKSGILEIADLLVVTKGDLAGAPQAARDLHESLPSVEGADQRWMPTVQTVSATQQQGLDALMSSLNAHRAFLDAQADGRQRLERLARDRCQRFFAQRITQGLAVRYHAQLEQCAVLAVKDPFAAYLALAALVQQVNAS